MGAQLVGGGLSLSFEGKRCKKEDAATASQQLVAELVLAKAFWFL